MIIGIFFWLFCAVLNFLVIWIWFFVCLFITIEEKLIRIDGQRILTLSLLLIQIVSTNYYFGFTFLKYWLSLHQISLLLWTLNSILNRFIFILVFMIHLGVFICWWIMLIRIFLLGGNLLCDLLLLGGLNCGFTLRFFFGLLFRWFWIRILVVFLVEWELAALCFIFVKVMQFDYTLCFEAIFGNVFYIFWNNIYCFFLYFFMDSWQLSLFRWLWFNYVRFGCFVILITVYVSIWIVLQVVNLRWWILNWRKPIITSRQVFIFSILWFFLFRSFFLIFKNLLEKSLFLSFYWGEHHLLLLNFSRYWF